MKLMQTEPPDCGCQVQASGVVTCLAWQCHLSTQSLSSIVPRFPHQQNKGTARVVPWRVSFKALGHWGSHELIPHPSPHGSHDGLFPALPGSDPKKRLANRG